MVNKDLPGGYVYAGVPAKKISTFEQFWEKRKNVLYPKKFKRKGDSMPKAQQELSDITGIQPSNLARFESGGRVPTLIVLEKYANALGKHIEIKICDN